MRQIRYKDIVKEAVVNPKTILLNLWIIIVSIPGLSDVIVLANIPLDILVSTCIGIWLYLRYGIKDFSILKICIFLTFTFVFINEGIYQTFLSFMLLFPVFWSSKLVHRIKLSTKIILLVISVISIVNIIESGGVELTKWRLPCKLITLIIVVRSSLLQIVLIYFSGFRSLFLIPLKRMILFILPIYLFLMFRDDAWISRLVWNADRFQYIKSIGTGFMHSSSRLNYVYSKGQLGYDRFNQTLSVMDFGYVDLYIKFGLILGSIYITLFLFYGIKTIGYKLALALFLINITFGILSHEALLWETFYVIEYIRIYGFKNNSFKIA